MYIGSCSVLINGSLLKAASSVALADWLDLQQIVFYVPGLMFDSFSLSAVGCNNVLLNTS